MRLESSASLRRCGTGKAYKFLRQSCSRPISSALGWMTIADLLKTFTRNERQLSLEACQENLASEGWNLRCQTASPRSLATVASDNDSFCANLIRHLFDPRPRATDSASIVLKGIVTSSRLVHCRTETRRFTWRGCIIGGTGRTTFSYS